MKNYGLVTTVLAILLLAGAAQAVEMRGELVLFKGPILEYDTFHRTPVCEGLLDVHVGQDRQNFNSHRNNNCEGRYTLTLRGKAGSTVTLFGNVEFGQERGYLIIRKKDESMIWLNDLENIPPNQWVTREADNSYGAYDVYFAAAPRFSQNISSVKWGKWSW